MGFVFIGCKLKVLFNIIENVVVFNMEVDSLNVVILGEDVVFGFFIFDLFIKEVWWEMMVKCGQKCMAIWCIIVLENLVEDVQLALSQ